MVSNDTGAISTVARDTQVHLPAGLVLGLGGAFEAMAAGFTRLAEAVCALAGAVAKAATADPTKSTNLQSAVITITQHHGFNVGRSGEFRKKLMRAGSDQAATGRST